MIAIIIPALFIIVSDILKIFKLVGVKNKINEINKKDEKIKKEREKIESIRKEVLRKKLNLNTHEAFIEPIVTKKKTRVVVAFDPKEKIKRENYQKRKTKLSEKKKKVISSFCLYFENNKKVQDVYL